MILIAVVDDAGGLLFNHRRQSQDRRLRERILSLSAHSRLWMNRYTRAQFDDCPGAHQIRVEEACLSAAGAGEFCFVETEAVAPYARQIERVVLFRWNRSYPGDFFFDLDLSAPPWKRIEQEDFPGSSHENITKEVYIRA